MSNVILVSGHLFADGEVITRVSDQEAVSYGVYMGDLFDVEWLVDFDRKEEAMAFAHEMQEVMNELSTGFYNIIDGTF
jgi:hypothetical protein